tara:strand:+ start:1570 stop:1743 length:174 start_codon:yes stop_codon:yes gene_type:complete
MRRINIWSPAELNISGDAAGGKLSESKQKPAFERLLLPESETDIENLTIEKPAKIRE